MGVRDVGFLDQATEAPPAADPVRASRRAVRDQLAVAIDFRHGGKREIGIRYELNGVAGAPLVIVAGGISADRHALASDEFPHPGWWESQARSFDLDRVRIVAVDWLGADGKLDLPIDPADQARALAAVLDHLGIERAAAFVGASYGGMVGMHFASLFPGRIGRLVSLCAADRSHPYSSALRAVQRRALALGERSGDPAAGVALARALAMLTYRTPAEFAGRFDTPPSIDGTTVRTSAEDYLEVQGERLAGRLSAVAYRRLSESIDLHRIDPAGIRCPVTLIAADSDQLVPVADVERLAAAVPDSELHVIASLYGHDSFLKETARIDAILSPILSSLEACP